MTLGGRVLCVVQARWGERGGCLPTDAIPVDSSHDRLEIQQQVLTSADSALWAGLHHPVLVVERRGGTEGADAPPTAAQPPNESADAEPDPEAESDRIFLAIQAGDFSDGPAADELFERLRFSDDPFRGNAAFNAGLIRYANGDCNGAFEALDYAASAPGSELQHRLRDDALAASLGGCGEPVATLIGA